MVIASSKLYKKSIWDISEAEWNFNKIIRNEKVESRLTLSGDYLLCTKVHRKNLGINCGNGHSSKGQVIHATIDGKLSLCSKIHPSLPMNFPNNGDVNCKKCLIKIKKQNLHPKTIALVYSSSDFEITKPSHTH